VALQRGLIVALLVSIPLCAAMLLTGPALIALGQAPEVAARAAQYNILKLPTVPCFLVFTAMRAYLQGRTLMAPATWAMWLANAFNVLFNWALIFGHLGAPALGLRGAAIASTLTTFMLPVVLGLWVWRFRLHEGAWRPWSRASVAPAGLLETLRLGLPVGMQMALEAWAFSLSTLMAGWISVDALGAHHVVLNMAALAFMLPLGISMAAATRVGNLIGREDVEGMRRAVRMSIVLGAAAMLASSAAFVVLRETLPRLYTDDALVVMAAAQILPLAGAFGVADGVQVVAGGVLRGMGRPNAAALVNLVGYYALTLPLAYWLGFQQAAGLPGIWGALALGLLTVATAMVFWTRVTARRPLSELAVRLQS
jgi:MATE family multidrug resistance protein